jgi:hypothetical protein
MTLVIEVIVGILLAFWRKNRIGSGEIVATSLSAEMCFSDPRQVTSSITSSMAKSSRTHELSGCIYSSWQSEGEGGS